MKNNLIIKLTLAGVLATTLFPVLPLFQSGNNGTIIAKNENGSSDEENPFTYTRRDLMEVLPSPDKTL